MPYLDLYNKQDKEPANDQPGTSSPALAPPPESPGAVEAPPQPAPTGGGFINFARQFGANQPAIAKQSKSIEDKATEQAKTAQTNLATVGTNFSNQVAEGSKAPADLKAQAAQKYTGPTDFTATAGSKEAKQGLDQAQAGVSRLATWGGIQEAQGASGAGAGGNRLNAALSGSNTQMFSGLRNQFGNISDAYGKAAETAKGQVTAAQGAVAGRAAQATTDLAAQAAAAKAANEGTAPGTVSVEGLPPDNTNDVKGLAVQDETYGNKQAPGESVAHLQMRIRTRASRLGAQGRVVGKKETAVEGNTETRRNLGLGDEKGNI
jgi:hypothetical protein